MENKMSELIEASEYQYEEFCKETEQKISDFINENKYNWTAEDIIKEYVYKYTKGDYCSHSAVKVINKFNV